MDTPYDKTAACIVKSPTVIYGLSYRPSLEPAVSDNQDHPAFGWPTGPEISQCNLEVVSQVLSKMGQGCRSIVEIGVHRNEGGSITNVLMNNRPSGSTYVGIDVNDKSYLDDPSSKVFTIMSNSHDQFSIRQRLQQIGVERIDILMIDGWHSVNTCVNDWCYTDLLSDGGVVILHDTNAHPGCVALFEAVDGDIFDKVRHCVGQDDMGIATFWHKKKNHLIDFHRML